mgnify:CR=1 FL=1
MAEHRVRLVEHLAEIGDPLERHAELFRQGIDLIVALGQELVQRRIEITDRDRAIAHGFEEAFEILLLHRQELG